MHKKNASDLLMKHIVDNNIHIALLQEPYYNKKRKIIPSVPRGYVVYVNNSENPLAAVIVKENIHHFPLTNYFSDNLIAVQINLKASAIAVASLYCPGRSEPIPASFIRFLDKYYPSQPNLVLGADTNAHCAVMGYNASDERGTRWEELVAEKSWVIHNIIGEPTFRNSTSH